ncbi:hypothetical protein [Kouleothrix sp.]|uniref:hypothetical protein n=1 Tax=Kouleothrix sp. TaxID=2779161 RepID=UPI00391AD0C2
MNIHVSPVPDDDAVAAVLAALEHYLAAEQADDEAPAGPHEPWRTAGKLAAQGLPPSRAVAARWGSADRARRGERWSHGIVGL